MGGPSAEREVSLKTGAMVARALDPKKYVVRELTVTQEGKWLSPRRVISLRKGGARKSREKQIALRGGAALDRIRDEKVDVVFIAMHGTYGEDGTLQGLLESTGIPYTGSGVLASALAMDKAKAAEIFSHHGLKTPRHITFTRAEWARERNEILGRAISLFGFPSVVKPRSLGSSVGISIPKTAKELASAILKALKASRDVMIQEFISGIEVTCAVLDGKNGELLALPPTQIIPKVSDFFDYEAKYAVGGSEEITPPRLPKRTIEEVQSIARTAHAALGCSGMSRTDTIVSPKGIYVLETNTIPGMTETSLLPQAAKAAGISFSELLDRIIEAGISRYA